MTASNGNGEFKGTVKEAIRRMDLNIAKIEAGLENFDARMEMRFEKFKSDLKEVFVTKEGLNNCIEEKITGTPLDNRKSNWQKAGIWIAIIFGVLGFLTSIINILKPR